MESSHCNREEGGGWQTGLADAQCGTNGWMERGKMKQGSDRGYVPTDLIMEEQEGRRGREVEVSLPT